MYYTVWAFYSEKKNKGLEIRKINTKIIQTCFHFWKWKHEVTQTNLWPHQPRLEEGPLRKLGACKWISLPASWEPWPHSPVSSTGPSGSAPWRVGLYLPTPRGSLWDIWLGPGAEPGCPRHREAGGRPLLQLSGDVLSLAWKLSPCSLHKAPSTLPGLTNSVGSQTPNRFKLGIHLSVAAWKDWRTTGLGADWFWLCHQLAVWLWESPSAALNLCEWGQCRIHGRPTGRAHWNEGGEWLAQRLVPGAQQIPIWFSERGPKTCFLARRLHPHLL